MMRVFVDESYNKDRFFVWMTLISKRARSKLTRKITEIKKKYGVETYEIKYSKCKWNNKLLAAKEMIDAFFDSTACFKSIWIHKASDWFFLGAYQEKETHTTSQVHDSMQKILMNQLIKNSCKDIHWWVLFLDEWKMGNHISDLSRVHTMQNRTFSTIEELDSKKELLLQINDLLLWSVYWYNVPPKNKYKKALIAYVRKKANIGNVDDFSLSQIYRNQFTKRSIVEQCHPKFNIWFFVPKQENLIFPKRKALS